MSTLGHDDADLMYHAPSVVKHRVANDDAPKKPKKPKETSPRASLHAGTVIRKPKNPTVAAAGAEKAAKKRVAADKGTLAMVALQEKEAKKRAKNLIKTQKANQSSYARIAKLFGAIDAEVNKIGTRYQEAH